MLVSAVSGEGLDSLLARIEAILAVNRLTLSLEIPPEDGKGLAWLYAHTEVLARNLKKNGVTHVTIRIAPEREAEVRKRFELGVA
jgi:GTP-binding protein HflX